MPVTYYTRRSQGSMGGGGGGGGIRLQVNATMTFP